MESGNGGASSKGSLVPISQYSDVFQTDILPPLKSAYLYEESKQCFTYKSAVLLKNPALEEKYSAFRAKRSEEGYSEEDLKESFAFLLFDDVNKANELGETGVLTGNSTCTTLGDPSNGVYISMYSDCLDLNRWYHGKSGYIAIIRLTKGRVKKVLENYTQNFTMPTAGFDCHVSDQLPSVSAKTSSFLAFERTQYYVYELLDDGSNLTTQSPSAACPFAIVSFSYTDTEAKLEAPQEKSEEKKLVFHYFPWRGQLQIGTQFFDVGLRSASGALIPAELPPVVKIDRAITMLDLRQLLPSAVFETCFSGEVFIDGLYFSLCVLVSSEREETHSLSILLQEVKEKDLALTIQLNDGGFLILLHSSNFLTYDDTASSATDVLQGMFVFPDSQVIQRDTKFGQRKCAMSSEILQVLPVLSYAEGEIEKAPIDPGEELCEVLAHHMQSYTALINPGLATSPSRELSIFPDQYDVPVAHKHLYSSPEWTNGAWQSFRSYLNKPISFQLPVSKASEILAAGQEEQIEDLDEDVYICLSSPEEAPKPFSVDSEQQLTDQRSPVNGETLEDSCTPSAEGQFDLKAVPENVVPDDLRAEVSTKSTVKSDLTVVNETDDMKATNLLTPSTSDDLPAELIVSITSAERTVTDKSLSMISTVSATKPSDFQVSVFSTATLQKAGVNSLNDETVVDFPEVTNLTKSKRKKLHWRHSKGQKKVSKACIEIPTLQIPVEDDNLKSQKEEQAKESSGHSLSSNPSNIDPTKVQSRKRKFKKSSPKMEKVRSASGELAVPMEKKIHPGMQSVESSVVMDLEACPLRRKTERWALKPVISECGRVLVPHGSVDFTDQIKSLKDDLESTKDEQCPQKMSDTSLNAHDTVEMEQECSPTPDTEVGEKASKDRGNHLLNVVVGNLNPEHSILRLPEDVNGSLILKNAHYSLDSKTDGTATPPSKTIKEKETDTLSPGKIARKGELLLSKLKSVLLRGKRKSDLLVSEEITADTVLGTESCLKKDKVDSQTAILKRNYAITSVQDTNVHVKEVSKMLSVDPIFAFALGLTPKETPDKIQKTEGQGNQQGNYLSETKEQTILDKQTKIIQRPPSIFPRRGRIKMLKKHQDISTENVKKKWWLHFQSPACFASEKRKYKACSRDNSVRKTVKGKMNNACSSTDALNLLADLALSASNDQVPPQPDPALERKPEPSLKKGDLTKDLTSAEQASVLHALLRQPAVRPMLPLESPSPSHLVGSSELVGLVSKEHAYSLPPSSSLLLGLPGTPFQVSPLSGSTRLLHHHQTMYANGIETLHLSVGLEDKPGRQNPWTPEYLKKCRRKFRHSRTLVNKDESIQVTKQWKENYDFNLDSKFTSDPKDRTIVRALHGPWDFSMQDTSEEVQLIIHMWIGLFYSRSTARFFHVDSNLCSEESDSLEMSGGIVSAPAQSELKADSFAPIPSIADTADPLISKAFDLSKKDDSALDQGSLILDLSLRKSNAEIVTKDPQVNRKETSVSSDWKEDGEALNTLKPSVGLQEDVTVECIKKMLHTTEIINEVNDVGRAYENKKTFIPSQKAGSLEHTDVDSCKDDGTIVLAQEKMENVSAQPEHYQTASGIEHPLQEYNNEKTDMKGGIENSVATEISLVQRHGKDSSKYVTDEEVDSNKEAGDVVHTVEHDEIESKDGENWQVKEKSRQQGNVEPSPDVFHTNENSTNEESGVVCNGNLSENEKQLLREESKSVSPRKAEYVDDDLDCCTVHKEAGDVAHAVEHDEIESKDGENWQVKEKSYQQGNVEPSPDVFHTNENSTNEESGVVCNGNLSENEKQLLREESKSVSPRKAEYVDDDLDCCTVHKEAGDVAHAVEHDQIESKDGENWQVKEKSYQQGNVEPSPDVFQTNEDSTNEDSGVVCNVNLSKNEKRLSREESKSVSPGKAEYVDCCTVHKAEDYFGKEDGLDEKDSCVSNMEADSDLSNQPMSMMCDGPDSVKKDCISESDPNPPLDEQPSQADNVEGACCDLQLRKPCENGSAFAYEDLILEELPHALSETEPISNEPMFEKGSENDIFLDTTLYRKTTLPMSDEKKCSLDGSCTDGSNSPDGDETESQNKVIATINLSSDDHYDRDTKSTEGEQTVDSTAEKELFDHRSDSSPCKAEVALTKDTDPKWIPTNKGFEKSHSEVVIPFIGIYSSGEDTVQPHGSHSHGKVEEVVQGQEEIPFSETTSPETILPTGARSSSQMYSQNAELSTGKISLSFIDVSETNQPIVSESTSDQRCSTPTMDEKPYDCLTFSDPGSTSAYALSMSEQSTVDANPHHDRHPECELSIDKFLSVSSHTNTIIQIETVDIKQTLDQTPNPRSKCIATSLAPSHTSFHFEDKKMNNTTPAVQSASTSQELHTESTGHFLMSAFSKLEEVLDAKLKLQKTDSSGQHYFERTDQSQETPPGQDYCPPHRIGPSTESLQAIELNISQDIHKTTSPTNLSHETHPCSQRPVMAVKPSKSDDSSSRADYMSEDGQIQNDVMSHFPENKLTKTPVVTYTLPTTMLLEKKAESLESTSDGLNDEKQEAIELSSKSSWLSNLSDSKSQNISKKIPSSSLTVQSFESKKHYSKLVDGTKGVMTGSVLEKVGQTAKENIKMNHKACSDASTSHADHEDGSIADGRSLMCTVYNTSRKRSYSFLEQVSHRCIQDDPTEASMEQECLIFSEQMKQLLKRSRKGPIRQQDAQDRLNLPGASPVTVHFSNLEEQEDSVDDLKAYLDAQLLGQKIKVDMSDRKDLWEEEKTLHPQKCSQGTGKHMNHAGVHSVTSECARLYKAMMNDVCAVKKVPSRPKHLRMDSSHPKTEPSNHFDRCDQMKRKMDGSLGGNLKSVVKKSCRTKYRFYILVTSDDAFFERTKAQLEAEGHTAVQPSEFFLAEDSSSSLLIILRNEDIAEHICEVPHLLELKKSSAVQFAGIDEPDDVVNLTHQELFTRGGCIMLDSAALEPLSLCNMKKMSEILQELSRMGKWKWMLHYRDSRRLKENARLSAEAKEKKHFLNFCQDAGILDVLPYHECDLMSKDLPDYLTCLVRLQVQNISARYTVFITDTTADSSFGKNGILTMTFDSFLTCSPSKTFTA